jgi:uncharacterized protein (TIGR02145 family)
MKKLKTIIPVMVSLLLFSCGNKSNNNSSELTGIKIGTQTWATKNLDVSSFRNGEAIPEAKTDAEWIAAGEQGKPAWCYYENNPANGTKYGKLYNLYAVNDPRGLAPKGWHIPSDEEWTTLTDNLGGENGAGSQMKNASSWKENGNGSNSSGFAGLPGGVRGSGGTFVGVGTGGDWWSSSENGTNVPWGRELNCNSGNVYRSLNYKQDGFSVRCLSGSNTEQNASNADGNKSNSELRAIKIGAQTWATKNLDVISFRNGDAIPEAKTDAEWIAAGEQGKPAWCYYENNPANGTKYGKLYNWYAVHDSRSLAPADWHVPSDAEWAMLTDYLGGKNGAGTQMKSANGWINNGNGSNSSGFTGLPAGYRLGNGTFYNIGAFGYWWSSSEANAGNAWFSALGNDHADMDRIHSNKPKGFSVRCLRD